jgi:hypothetical protein
MANVVATYTPGPLSRRFAGPEGKSYLRTIGTLVVTTAGGTNAGEMPASLFGLNTFTGIGVFTLAANTYTYLGAPDATNGQSLIMGTPGAAADLATGTYAVIVEGISA